MASIKIKFTVGLFVIIGFSFVTASVIWLGMSHYFEKGNYYVSFFDESVQGLAKDSPVKFMGVCIGRVANIGVAPDAKTIQVVLKIETELDLDDRVVAQLKSVGVTGIMYVEIEKKEKDEPDFSPRITFSTRYPVIPTKPSGIKKFREGINDVFNQISEIDTRGIAEKIKSTLDLINQSIQEAKLKELSADAKSSLSRARQIMDSVEKAGNAVTRLAVNAENAASGFNKTTARIDKIIKENEKGFEKAVSEFRDSVKKTGIMLKNGNNFIKGSEERLNNLQRHLLTTLQHLEKASDNLNRFVEIIADQPSQLILGEPLPAREENRK
jgi:phospholipid/cholesterol/gamma-HCH transport system substrate-binding protein